MVPNLFCVVASQPMCNNLHGLGQRLSPSQNQLLLVMNSAVVPIAIGQEHCMERFQFIDFMVRKKSAVNVVQFICIQ